MVSIILKVFIISCIGFCLSCSAGLGVKTKGKIAHEHEELGNEKSQVDPEESSPIESMDPPEHSEPTDGESDDLKDPEIEEKTQASSNTTELLEKEKKALSDLSSEVVDRNCELPEGLKTMLNKSSLAHKVQLKTYSKDLLLSTDGDCEDSSITVQCMDGAFDVQPSLHTTCRKNSKPGLSSSNLTFYIDYSESKVVVTCSAKGSDSDGDPLRYDFTIKNGSNPVYSVSGTEDSVSYEQLLSDAPAQFSCEVSLSDSYEQTEIQNHTIDRVFLKPAFTGSHDAIALRKTNGEVVVWGGEDKGAAVHYNPGTVSGHISHGDADSDGVADLVDLDSNGGLIVSQILGNDDAFAALRSDGSIVTWGKDLKGGDTISPYNGSATNETFGDANNNRIADALEPSQNGGFKFTAILGQGNDSAFAALREDGALLTFGVAGQGGGSSRTVGSITNATTLGDVNGNWIADPLEPAQNGGLKVDKVVASQLAYAAIRNNGSVITWGYNQRGGASVETNGTLSNIITLGDSNSNGVADPLDPSSNGNLKSEKIFSTSYGFAALRDDGSVITWGWNSKGGASTGTVSNTFTHPDANSNQVSDLMEPSLNGSLLVTDIANTYTAFAAIRSDGSVVTWGDQASGGAATGTVSATTTHPDSNTNGISDLMEPALNGGLRVESISGRSSCFAAIRSDGSVVSWGNSSQGGSITSIASYTGLTYGNADGVADELDPALNGNKKATKIFNSGQGFMVLLDDGSVVVWGKDDGGGSTTFNNASDGNSNGVADLLEFSQNGSLTIQDALEADRAFGALRSDGSFFIWGWPLSGGDVLSQLGDVNSNYIADRLDPLSNGNLKIVDYHASSFAITILRSDGSIVSTGFATLGGVSASTPGSISGTVTFEDTDANGVADTLEGI